MCWLLLYTDDNILIKLSTILLMKTYKYDDVLFEENYSYFLLVLMSMQNYFFYGLTVLIFSSLFRRYRMKSEEIQ